jgi:uncharacterized protein (TIGR02117 family)
VNIKRCKWIQNLWGQRIGRWVGVAFVLTLILGILIPTKWVSQPQVDCSVPIYVSSVNHFHAELIVPVRHPVYNWRQRLDLNQLGPNADRYQYLSFGWGDRGFFMNPSYDPITFFDVLFLPGPTVMHVWGHTTVPLQLGSAFEIKQLFLSQAEYLKLAEFIHQGFQRDRQGHTRYIRQGLYPDSGFFEAEGTYSFLRTCNVWTADALRQADVNTPHWAALAPAIMRQLKGDCS